MQGCNSGTLDHRGDVAILACILYPAIYHLARKVDTSRCRCFGNLHIEPSIHEGIVYNVLNFGIAIAHLARSFLIIHHTQHTCSIPLWVDTGMPTYR